jgi:hypothetical protein
MKIRDVLWARILRSYLYWGGVCVFVMVGLALLPKDFSRIIWIPLACLAIAIPYGLLMARIVCPLCEYPFVKIGFLRIKFGSGKYRINHCPHCGVGLDTVAGPDNSFKPNPLRGSA